ncbi:MAG: LPXTG cell wall anchor domain-containing protein [Clostridia bacterium]|nr:LPXTG cell wall anchor domain-containing protein [Clostridia bacterium]
MNSWFSSKTVSAEAGRWAAALALALVLAGGLLLRRKREET